LTPDIPQIYKIALILGLPLVAGFYITKFFGHLWVMPIFYSIVSIMFFIFRKKLGDTFYEEDVLAKKMSKNVSWPILKNMSHESIPEGKEKEVKEPYIRSAIQFGRWYLFIALVITLYYIIYRWLLAE